MRLAVVEDDPWKRAAIADRLDSLNDVHVVHALDQDQAAGWALDRWEDIDTAIVDVFDDQAPGEVGTDLYSGIAAIERLTRCPVRVLAIMPHQPHPLVQLRLVHAAPDLIYSRWELPSVESFIEALHRPGTDRAPASLTPASLSVFGVREPRPNDAVRAYVSSPLHGLIQPNVTLTDLKVSRREVEAFRRQIASTGFHGTEYRSRSTGTVRAPRWPDVCEYLLRLLGRVEVPTSSHDRPWLLTGAS
jgi:DNA-binding NarL/FixJ family response regulator